MNDTVTLYGSSTCPAVPAVRATLERADVPFQYVNISRDREARSTVMAINNGYASVPTLAFPDGTTLTEPSQRELEEKLQSLGYRVTPATVLQRLQVVGQSPIFLTLGIVFLAIGLLQASGVFLVGGIAFLFLGIASRLPIR